MIRRPRNWRLGRYLLTGTIRQLGSRVRLSLTLTDTETDTVVWSGRARYPFDALVDGFDDLASKMARSGQTEVSPPKTNQLAGGTAAHEQSEGMQEARERARVAHNLIVKRRHSGRTEKRRKASLNRTVGRRK